MSTGGLCAPAGVVAPQSSVVNNRETQHPTRVEWPTIVVAVAVWAMWIGLVFGHASIPWPLSLIGLGLAGGWYMSLQHEVLHGHPTPWGWLNVALAGAPLSLWLPYWLYRDEHLLHHEVELTIPDEDPETFYVSPAHWAHAGPVRRTTLRVSRTFIGRLLIGALLEHWGLLRQPPMPSAASSNRPASSTPTASASGKLPEDLGIVAEITGQKKNRVYSYQAYVNLLSR